jgi:hypothetical protein
MSKPNPRPLSRKARRCAVDHPSTTGDVSKSGHLHSQFLMEAAVLAGRRSEAS